MQNEQDFKATWKRWFIYRSKKSLFLELLWTNFLYKNIDKKNQINKFFFFSLSCIKHHKIANRKFVILYTVSNSQMKLWGWHRVKEFFFVTFLLIVIKFLKQENTLLLLKQNKKHMGCSEDIIINIFII